MRTVIIAFVLLAGALLVVFFLSGQNTEMAKPEATQQETPAVTAPELVEEVEETVTEAVEDATETAQEAAEEVVEQAEEAATEAVETTQEQAEEMVEDAVNEALGTTETATEAAESTAEAAEAAVPDMSDPLSVETFDMAKANEVIEGSSLDALQQNTLKLRWSKPKTILNC